MNNQRVYNNNQQGVFVGRQACPLFWSLLFRSFVYNDETEEAVTLQQVRGTAYGTKKTIYGKKMKICSSFNDILSQLLYLCNHIY